MRTLCTAFVVFLLTFGISASAQEGYVQTQCVFSSVPIASSGAGFDAQGTVGEPITGVIPGVISVSQGFWYPVAAYTSVAPGGTYRFELHPNAPNPFNPTTAFMFTVPGSAGVTARARLDLYDVSGRLIVTLVDATLPAGDHSVTWRGQDSNGRPVGSGVYYARLTVGNQTASTRTVLLK